MNESSCLENTETETIIKVSAKTKMKKQQQKRLKDAKELHRAEKHNDHEDEQPGSKAKLGKQPQSCSFLVSLLSLALALM